MSSRIKKGTTPLVEDSLPAEKQLLHSPEKPVGPPRRPPTTNNHNNNHNTDDNKNNTSSSSSTNSNPKTANPRTRRPPPPSISKTERIFFIFIFFILILITLVLSLAVLSAYTTNSWTFGYSIRSIDDVPLAASKAFRDFKKFILPSAWIPKVGKIGKARESSFSGAQSHASLPTWKLEFLKSRDGSNPGLPIYLSITGLIFDVSSGRQHYGPDGGYHFLAGKDATVSFSTGCFDDSCFATQPVGWEAIPENERKSINDWVQTYLEKYKLVAKLEDVYQLYNDNHPLGKNQKYFTPLESDEL